VGPRNYVLDGSPDLLTGMGTFDGDDIRIFPHAAPFPVALM